MSDQKRLLIAAVLMAAVLFISWQFMGKASKGNETEGVQQLTLQSSTEELIDNDSVEDILKEEFAFEDTLKIRTDDKVYISESTPVERIITVIIRGNGDEIVNAEITTDGGAIRSWILPQYEDIPGGGNGGFVNFNRTPWMDRGIAFETDSPDTIIVDSDTETVVLTASDNREVKYTFTPDHYGFSIETHGFDEMITIPSNILPVSEMNVNSSRYFKAQWNADKIKSRNSNDIDEFEQIGNVKWIAVRSHYFAIILMPESYERAYGFLYPSGEDESPSIGVQDVRVNVYAGPLEYERMRKLGDNTKRLVDFGWPLIREIGWLIFWFCEKVLSFIDNWGLKIIVLAIVLKIVLMPLTTKSFRSMAKLKQIQPMMKELQDKYKNDPKALQTAMQKLYREEGVNPLGGCLPMLMQMPVFFALYRVLANSVQLRGASFVLWINDLSLPEILISLKTPILGLHGLGLLALLMGIAMFIQQKMTVTDQKQKGMMYMMPIFMTFLFMRFPAGLTLYWFTNNILTIGQQEMIKRKLESEQAEKS